MLCHVEREHGDDTIDSVMALPLAAGLGKGEATLKAVEAGLDAVEAGRVGSEVAVQVGDLRPQPCGFVLQATNALCQFVEPQVDAVEPPVELGELDPEKVEHFSVGYHARAYKGLV